MSTSAASVLVEPFDAYLRRRSLSAVAFTPGEAVTVAIALLRGCRRATGRFTGAVWWVRADGCPVAVEDDESPDAIAATADTLEQIATITEEDATREMLTRARESVLTRPPREWEALERRLFHHADPLPLVLGPLTPVTGAPSDPGVDAPSGGAAAWDVPAASRSPAASRDVVGPGAPSRVLALVDADLADAVQEVLREFRTRWRTSRVVRLGAMGAAAALVAVIGLLVWTSPVTPEATAVDPSPTPSDGIPRSTQAPTELPAELVTSSDSPSPPSAPVSPDRAADTTGSTAAPPPQGGAMLSDDPVTAARAVFTEVDRCADDTACVAAYEGDSTSSREPLPPGAASGDIQLIDDFGGVAVVRLAVDAITQYVTLVRQEDRWLVRAVRTVADQPS